MISKKAASMDVSYCHGNLGDSSPFRKEELSLRIIPCSYHILEGFQRLMSFRLTLVRDGSITRAIYPPCSVLSNFILVLPCLEGNGLSGQSCYILPITFYGMKALTSRAQDYLKIIYKLSSGGKRVRLVNLSKKLGIKMPTAVQMLKSLADQGFVIYEKHGVIELTPEGERIAREVYERHELLLKFFTKYLGVSPKIAERDACGMEHHLSEETYERLLKFIEFMEGCPNGLPSWLEGFHYYLRWGKRPTKRADRDVAILPVRRLSELGIQEIGKVVMVRAGPDERLRLADRGILIGSTVKVMGKGKDTITLEVDGKLTELGDEADLVYVI